MIKPLYLILIILFLFTGQIISAQEKPNVLMIVLDDLNDYVGVMEGHPQARTPFIDKLADHGVLFMNAHSNVPVCMPSRDRFYEWYSTNNFRQLGVSKLAKK